MNFLPQCLTKRVEEGDLVSTIVRCGTQCFKYPDVALTSAGRSQSEGREAVAEGDAQIKLLAAQLRERRRWRPQVYPGGSFHQRNG